MMPWQGLQTLKEPDCPNWTPDIREVHLESNIWPHVPGLNQCLFTEVIQSTRLTTVVFPAKRCKWIAAVETVPCVLVSHPVLLVKYLTLDLRKDGQ